MFAWRRAALRRRVLVNLKTDKALDGILFAKRGSILVLKMTKLHESGRPPVALDGDVIVERANVDFMQVFPSPEG